MSQTNSENRSKTSTLLPQSGPEILLGVAIIISLLVAACLIVSDYREKSALPEVDAYKVQKNSEHHLTIMCIDGYRYLMNDAAVRYAVQMWENGPEGPRPSQSPASDCSAPCQRIWPGASYPGPSGKTKGLPPLPADREPWLPGIAGRACQEKRNIG